MRLTETSSARRSPCRPTRATSTTVWARTTGSDRVRVAAMAAGSCASVASRPTTASSYAAKTACGGGSPTIARMDGDHTRTAPELSTTAMPSVAWSMTACSLKDASVRATRWRADRNTLEIALAVVASSGSSTGLLPARLKNGRASGPLFRSHPSNRPPCTPSPRSRTTARSPARTGRSSTQSVIVALSASKTFRNGASKPSISSSRSPEAVSAELSSTSALARSRSRACRWLCLKEWTRASTGRPTNGKQNRARHRHRDEDDGDADIAPDHHQAAEDLRPHPAQRRHTLDYVHHRWRGPAG